MAEQPIAVQTEQTSTAPIGIRAVTAQVLIGGQPVTVQQQVVTVADEYGNIIGANVDNTQLLTEILQELRTMTRLLAQSQGGFIP